MLRGMRNTVHGFEVVSAEYFLCKHTFTPDFTTLLHGQHTIESEADEHVKELKDVGISAEKTEASWLD